MNINKIDPMDEKLVKYDPQVFFEEDFETNINRFGENRELIEKYADFSQWNK